jgi:Co/Zn/Cd efflux system component
MMNKTRQKAESRRGRLVIHLSMSPSRTARLYFLLVLDLLFFVLEISIGKSSRSSEGSSLLIHPLGYAVGSLALVADSFHMLK